MPKFEFCSRIDKVKADKKIQLKRRLFNTMNDSYTTQKSLAKTSRCSRWSKREKILENSRETPQIIHFYSLVNKGRLLSSLA